MLSRAFSKRKDKDSGKPGEGHPMDDSDEDLPEDELIKKYAANKKALANLTTDFTGKAVKQSLRIPTNAIQRNIQQKVDKTIQNEPLLAAGKMNTA